MTTRATFGDFATTTRHHLDQLSRDNGLRFRAGGDADQTVRSMRRVLAVMIRYVGDIRAVFDAIPPAGRAGHAPWIRAASRAQECLANATTLLQPATTVGLAATGAHGTRLDTAAQSMTLGRDLLHTHLSTRPDWPNNADRSEWAPVITSVPLARTTLWELAGWARRIAPHGGRLAVAARHGTPQARRKLNAACQWLWILDWAVQAADEQRPVTASQVQLLHAIPASAPLSRRLPLGAEPVTALCDGIISTAERVRHAAWRAAASASWSPAMTMEALHDTAAYCTVISWNCHIILNAIASSPAHCSAADLGDHLTESANAADTARAAWLTAAKAWDTVGTDTRGTTSQATAETADLALWTGRLAYADPAWTPNSAPPAPPAPTRT